MSERSERAQSDPVGQPVNTRSRQPGQLRLLPAAESTYDWVLDERTRRVGRSGVAQARDVLRRARPPEPRQTAPVKKAS